MIKKENKWFIQIINYLKKQKFTDLISVIIAFIALVYTISSSMEQSKIISVQTDKLDTISRYTNRLIQTQLELSKPVLTIEKLKFGYRNGAIKDSLLITMMAFDLRNNGSRYADSAYIHLKFIGEGSKYQFTHLIRLPQPFQSNRGNGIFLFPMIHLKDINPVMCKIGMYWYDGLVGRKDSMISYSAYTLKKDGNFWGSEMDIASRRRFNQILINKKSLSVHDAKSVEVINKHYPEYSVLHYSN